jgi:hypothetical protein
MVVDRDPEIGRPAPGALGCLVKPPSCTKKSPQRLVVSRNGHRNYPSFEKGRRGRPTLWKRQNLRGIMGINLKHSTIYCSWQNWLISGVA